jgi:hypothetical protein
VRYALFQGFRNREAGAVFADKGHEIYRPIVVVHAASLNEISLGPQPLWEVIRLSPHRLHRLASINIITLKLAHTIRHYKQRLVFTATAVFQNLPPLSFVPFSTLPVSLTRQFWPRIKFLP